MAATACMADRFAPDRRRSSEISLQIEAFTAIAELHSFSGAGERLGMTASAMSQLIAEIYGILRTEWEAGHGFPGTGR